MTTRPLPRQPLGLRGLLIVTTAFIIVLMFAASTTVLDPPTAPPEIDGRSVSTATAEHASLVVAAADDLATLRRAVRMAPAIADALHDRIGLLRPAIYGRIPIHAAAPRP